MNSLHQGTVSFEITGHKMTGDLFLRRDRVHALEQSRGICPSEGAGCVHSGRGNHWVAPCAQGWPTSKDVSPT